MGTDDGERGVRGKGNCKSALPKKDDDLSCPICWNLGSDDQTKVCKRDKGRCAAYLEANKCGKRPKKCTGHHPENCKDCKAKILRRECDAYTDECRDMDCKVPSVFCPGHDHAGFWDLCRSQQKQCVKICKNENMDLKKGKNPYKNKAKKNKKNKNKN